MTKSKKIFVLYLVLMGISVFVLITDSSSRVKDNAIFSSAIVTVVFISAIVFRLLKAKVRK